MSALNFLNPTLAFIDGVGGPELVLILVVCLLLFGGKGMPNMARTIGKTMREFKKATSGIEDEIKRAMNDDDDDPKPAPRAKAPAALAGQSILPAHASAPTITNGEEASPATPAENLESTKPDHKPSPASSSDTPAASTNEAAPAKPSSEA